MTKLVASRDTSFLSFLFMDFDIHFYRLRGYIQAVILPALCFLKIMGKKATRTHVSNFQLFI